MKKLLRKRHVAAAKIIARRMEDAKNNASALPDLKWLAQDFARHFKEKDGKRFDYDEFMKLCGHPNWQEKKDEQHQPPVHPRGETVG